MNWSPIVEAPTDMKEPVVVRWTDKDGQEQRDFDFTEDGVWVRWHEYADHVRIVGGSGVSYEPPYQQWIALPPTNGT